MNRNTKAIIAVLISIIIIAAGILIIRESMIQNSKPSQLPPFPPYDFNAGTMRSGNTSANLTGSATAVLYSQNNGQGMFLHFYLLLLWQSVENRNYLSEVPWIQDVVNVDYKRAKIYTFICNPSGFVVECLVTDCYKPTG